MTYTTQATGFPEAKYWLVKNSATGKQELSVHGPGAAYYGSNWREVSALYTEEQVRAALAAQSDDARDAERYRFIRDNRGDGYSICEWVDGDYGEDGEGFYQDIRPAHIVDADIDAAMASQKAEK